MIPSVVQWGLCDRSARADGNRWPARPIRASESSARNLGSAISPKPLPFEPNQTRSAGTTGRVRSASFADTSIDHEFLVEPVQPLLKLLCGADHVLLELLGIPRQRQRGDRVGQPRLPGACCVEIPQGD